MLTRMKDQAIGHTDLDEQFAAECKEKLGYESMMGQIEQERERRKVLAALMKLGIVPFTPESVAKYKVKAANPFTSSLVYKFLIVAWVLAGTSIVVGIPIIAMATWDASYFRLFPCLLLWPFGFIPSAAICAAYKRTWNLIELSKYTRPIPEFVLQTALEIKSCPDLAESVLMIDELGGNEDPFLVLVTKYKEAFYLEVWNEPGYKQRREV